MFLSMCLSAAMSCQGDNLLAGNAALPRYFPLQREPRVDTGAIGGNFDQRPVSDLAQRCILGDEYVLVFLEGVLDFAKQFFRRLRFVLAMAIGDRPHEQAGVLGFRGDAVEDTQTETAVAVVVFVSAFAN